MNNCKYVLIMMICSWMFLQFSCICLASSGDTCDSLAASPNDTVLPSGVTGVEFKKIDAMKAIPVCEEATKSDPQNMRYTFQLGRAYQNLITIELQLILAGAAGSAEFVRLHRLTVQPSRVVETGD